MDELYISQELGEQKPESASELMFEQCMLYSSLYFCVQCLNVQDIVVARNKSSFENNTTTKGDIKIGEKGKGPSQAFIPFHTSSYDRGRVFKWLKRLYTSCVLHKRRLDSQDQMALRYSLELLCDLNDFLRLHHSLGGALSISAPDVLFHSFARRGWGWQASDLVGSLRACAHQLPPLEHLERYLTQL